MTATPRILIVDDEAQLRDLLSLTFENAGYAVKTAGSGRAAIALCSVHAFDVMLSDVTMPEMNGFQLAQWTSVHYPTIRTALMSGYDAILEKCSLSPVCHLIVKPFKSHEILSFVGLVLATA